MNSCILEVKFNEMYDRFQSGGSPSMEEVNMEIMSSWLDFLSAGFDADKVAEMMTPMDVFKHYETLTSYGATIDATELAYKLLEDDDEGFVESNLPTFKSRGANIDLIVSERFLVNDINDMIHMLENGVSARTVFSISEDLLSLNTKPESQDELKKAFSILHQYGLPLEDIKDWIDMNLNIYIIEDVVENEENWKMFGLKAEDFIDQYLDINAWRLIGALDDLPRTISPERFLTSVSMDEIIGNVNYVFDGFLDDYMDAGGDFNTLVAKFMNEIGYKPKLKYIEAMFDLAWADITAIDLNQFASCCNQCEEISEEQKRCYCEDLLSISDSEDTKEQLLKLLK